MLTYELKKSPGVPLYEALYRCIRLDILSGTLRPGQKLPSKRALAANLEVSKITVEGAYDQLLAEGYIRSREKVGYFVEEVYPTAPTPPPALREAAAPESPDWTIDLTANGTFGFPFSVWSRLQREVMLDLQQELLLPLPNRGIRQLRQAIADHLLQFRGLRVDPENILLGAGTDFLYNLLIQLLGREKVYAVEEPGYGKIRRIYAAGGVECISAPMDEHGVLPKVGAQVLHLSPSHHFPTGLVTPLSRRQALLAWAHAQPGRYIIEDDYDSEFRFDSHPVSAMAALQGGERVIYMNTFSKTLAPSIRISYLVLPDALMARFQEKLGFYSCTVPSFEQYTLARFLSRGYFEKHINRMRKAYRTLRDQVARLFQSYPAFSMTEEDAGLHFLLKVNTHLSDEALTEAFRLSGIRIRCLSHYYHGAVPSWAEKSIVVNYSGLRPGDLTALGQALQELEKQL